MMRNRPEDMNIRFAELSRRNKELVKSMATKTSAQEILDSCGK